MIKYIPQFTGRTINLLETLEYLGEKVSVVRYYSEVLKLPKAGEVVNTFSTGGREVIGSVVELSPCCYEVTARFIGVKGISETEEHYLWSLFKKGRKL